MDLRSLEKQYGRELQTSSSTEAALTACIVEFSQCLADEECVTCNTDAAESDDDIDCTTTEDYEDLCDEYLASQTSPTCDQNRFVTNLGTCLATFVCADGVEGSCSSAGSSSLPPLTHMSTLAPALLVGLLFCKGLIFRGV